MVTFGFAVAMLEAVYTIGAVWIGVLFYREWRNLKNSIVAGRLTDRNMQFMDVLSGDDSPVKTGFVAAILWPKIAWDIWRQRRKDRA